MREFDLSTVARACIDFVNQNTRLRVKVDQLEIVRQRIMFQAPQDLDLTSATQRKGLDAACRVESSLLASASPSLNVKISLIA
jgi:hypothetical protein